jgi:Protein of unknown function, DUF547
MPNCPHSARRRPARTAPPRPAGRVAQAALTTVAVLAAQAALAALTAVAVLAAGVARAAPAPHAPPKAEPWPRWEVHDESNYLHIDHGAWSEVLKRNVITKHPSGINRVKYEHFGRVDRLILTAYLGQQAGLNISGYNRNEQKAYWINLYNALTVQAVLEHWPLQSIRDIVLPPGLLNEGPWSAPLVTVEGVKLSLDDIEHRILRPIWHDPRVLYALNRASLGSPNLPPTAYTVFNMEGLLDEQARAFVNDPRGVRFAEGRLVLSSVYEAYEADLGGSPAAVLEHLRRYAKAPLAARLAQWHGGYETAFDWRINAP